MNTPITYSNLSKIKTQFRTKGNITGNFGVAKVKAGSTLNELGVTDAKVVKCTTQNEYLNRLYVAFDETDDAALKKFIYQEIRKILIQQGRW